jgi:7-cyano-7-deazaguanine reductase
MTATGHDPSEHPPRNLRHLGKVSNRPDRELDLIDWTGGPVQVTLHTREFTTFCPVTGQPDFAELTVSYTPRDHLVETKSFKLYLWTFRDERGFNEYICDCIANEFFKRVRPEYVLVTLDYNPRGGLAVRVRAERHGEKG